MDYYVFVTKQCNMRCKYCVFDGKLNINSIEDAPNVEETAKFILKNIKEHGHIDNKIFFYGGEPTLNLKWITDFIKITDGKLKYALQTNGTLLEKIDPELIKKINFLEISIDGKKEINDKFRGKGTFDNLIRNLNHVKQPFNGEIVARMTYVPENRLSESVKYILDELKFNRVYWMHEDHITKPTEWEKSHEEYSEEIDILLEYWLENLRNGIIKNIIPFQCITSSFLSKAENLNFRCGFDTFLMAIDSDGSCYNCDLMITEDKRDRIGDIENGITRYNIPKNDIYEKICKKCEYLKYCGGRCFTLSYNEDRERFDVFCKRTKMLIEKIRDIIPEIQNLIKNDVIRKDDIEIKIPLTEQIP